jgi:hypothetical protein
MSGAKFINGFFQVTVCNEQSNAKLKNSTLLEKTMWISIHDLDEKLKLDEGVKYHNKYELLC